MHVYVVFAHPTRRSFTGEVLDELCRRFDDGRHLCEIGGLYEMDFKCEVLQGHGGFSASGSWQRSSHQQ